MYNRFILRLSKCLEEVNIPEWMTKVMISLIQKDLQKIEHLQQTDNMFPYMENPDRADEYCMPSTISGRRKKMPQWKKRNNYK